MVVIVPFALLGTGLTGRRTGLRDLRAELGLAGAQPRTQRGDVRDVPTAPETLGHLLAVARTLVGTPLTDLRGFDAAVDARFHLVAQADLLDCHRTSVEGSLPFVRCG